MSTERYDLDLTRSTSDAVAITPHDTTLFRATRGLYIGTAGVIKVLHADSLVAVTYPVTVAGYVYPWAVVRVYATDTTAADIIAQY